MRIVVDITHPADINFFKNAINILKNKYNININMTILPRHGIISILQKEFEETRYKCIGWYSSSLIGKSLSLVGRSVDLLKYLKKINPDLITAFGSYGSAQASYLAGKPSIIFEDDIEYKLGYYSYKPFATRIILPAHIPETGRAIKKYKGFKELAYLHPNYFKPDKKVPHRFGLIPSNYIFIREVSNSSLNYRNLQEGRIIQICSQLIDMGLDIVLSLENKRLKSMIKNDNCIILDKPLLIDDIYSLLHFALFTISSGDTMARESCLVGTPAIYTGGREMSVNKELEKIGCLMKVSPNDTNQIIAKINEIMEYDLKNETKRIITRKIKFEWEDTTEVIIRNLLEPLESREV